MLAVNRLRLKVQRKLVTICTGLKQSACPRSRVEKYLNAFETALGPFGGKDQGEQWMDSVADEVPPSPMSLHI